MSSTTSAPRGIRDTRSGKIAVALAANPSHLEAVNPVVEGMTRAPRPTGTSRDGVHDPTAAMPVLLHGDAAFAGQGIVAETLNLYALEGYSTGGTLHVITNNQVGFTTDPSQGRSTRYSSDLAKGFDTPIIHVNADDPEAAHLGRPARARLPGPLRARRRDRPRRLSPLRAQRAGRAGVHPADHGEPDRGAPDGARAVRRPAGRAGRAHPGGGRRARRRGRLPRLHEAHDRLRASFGQEIPAKAPDESVPARPAHRRRHDACPRSGSAAQRSSSSVCREGFTVNPKLARQLERRAVALDEGGIDWGHAEALAFASLLREGVPIRLTGQDTERGTFSPPPPRLPRLRHR